MQDVVAGLAIERESASEQRRIHLIVAATSIQPERGREGRVQRFERSHVVATAQIHNQRDCWVRKADAFERHGVREILDQRVPGNRGVVHDLQVVSDPIF